MLDAYARGEDLHAKTAASIAGIPLDQVTPGQRQAAKPVNFGTLYGQQAPGLSNVARTNYGVEMTLQDATTALKGFSRAYPQLAHWQTQRRQQAEQQGYVTSHCGLVRDFRTQRKGYLFGEAVNMPVQATAAEILLASLKRLRYRLYGCVHDEITLLVPTTQTEDAMTHLNDIMQFGFLEVFPSGEKLLNGLVDVKTGTTWAEVH